MTIQYVYTNNLPKKKKIQYVYTNNLPKKKRKKKSNS